MSKPNEHTEKIDTQLANEIKLLTKAQFEKRGWDAFLQRGEKIASLERAIALMSEELETVRKSLSEHEKSYSALEGKIEEQIKQALIVQKEDLSKAHGLEIEELKSKIRRLEEQIKGLRDEHRRAIDDLKRNHQAGLSDLTERNIKIRKAIKAALEILRNSNSCLAKGTSPKDSIDEAMIEVFNMLLPFRYDE